MLKRLFMLAAGFVAVASAVQAGPLVALTTPLGRIVVELYDDKPVTVANFLSYIDSGRYDNSFAHRLVPGFVLQGGGFTLQGSTVTAVPTFPQIVNEYNVGQVRSNVLGTLAMAKLGGNPDSATSQWFFNLGDNSANLDTQNGGFTVFGGVVEGLDVLELFNTTFPYMPADGGRGVYIYASPFDRLPLLQEQPPFVYTTWAVIPEPGTSALLAASALVFLAAPGLRPAAGRRGRAGG